MAQSIVFFALSVSLILLAMSGLLPGFLLWLAISTAIMGIAYLSKAPQVICGKDRLGRMSIALLVLNLPWLVFTWSVWLLLALASREQPATRIPGSNVWISRYPLFGVDLSVFDRIFDLTSEFPAVHRKHPAYECLANLDGCELKNTRPSQAIGVDEKVLIHCGQGHGRSATFAAALLTVLGKFATTEEAYHAILAVRPGARVSASQRRQIAQLQPRAER